MFDELRRMFGGMSSGLFCGPFDENKSSFCGGMPGQGRPFVRVEVKRKAPGHIFAEMAQRAREKQVEGLQEVITAFYLEGEQSAKEIKKLRKKNKKLRNENQQLSDIVREREIEIAELQRRIERLNMTLESSLASADNETSADDEGGETPSSDDSVSDGTADEVGAP